MAACREPLIKRLDPIDEYILLAQSKLIREFYESMHERMWLIRARDLTPAYIEELLKLLDGKES